MSNSYVSCDEDDLAVKSCTGNTGAYTWDDLGSVWASHPPKGHIFSLTVSQSNHYVVLCPNLFFDATKTPNMSTQLQTIRDKPSKAMNMYSLYGNLGSIYFHETYVHRFISLYRAWYFLSISLNPILTSFPKISLGSYCYQPESRGRRSR